MTAATTEDHIPGRAIFDSRNWPEGYNFPACDACNGLSRFDELIIAMLSRIRYRDDSTTEQQDAEMRRAMDGVKSNFPEAYRAMRPRANDVRRFLRNTGRERQPGLALSDVPIVKLNHPEFLLAIKTFSTKLFCALHYKHTGTIVPSTGVIIGWFFSNVQVFDGKIPADILSIVQSRPALTRSNNDLHDQFSYEFTVAIEKTTSVYLCSFRESFAVIGMVSITDDLPSDFDENFDYGRFRSAPFRRDARVEL
jgi:hypothetical protein